MTLTLELSILENVEPFLRSLHLLSARMMWSQTCWSCSEAGGRQLGRRAGEAGKGDGARGRGQAERLLREHGVAVPVVAGGQGVGPGGGGGEGVVVYAGRHAGSVV